MRRLEKSLQFQKGDIATLLNTGPPAERMNNTKRIRVLHLLSSFASGGAETNLLALLPHFNKDQFGHIIAFGGGGELEYEFLKTGCQLLKLSPRPIKLQSIFESQAILKKIKGLSPTIIHSHLDGPNLIGLMAKRTLKCKLVLHFHGLGIIPRKYLPGRDIKHFLWNPIVHKYRYCDHAIAICKYQLPFLRRLGVDDRKVSLIPNGINVIDVHIKNKKNNDEYRFVNVARFFLGKEHDLLIRAFRNIILEVPNARLVLVGDGPLRTSIEDQVKLLGLDDKVFFLGIRKDIPQILADCDCFVLPSRWELHPITILEAMRAGLPVIATDVGGVPDTVADGISGLVVKASDEAGLTKAMIALTAKPELGRKMGEEGVRIVREKFSNAFVAHKIESVYHTVLGDTP